MPRVEPEPRPTIVLGGGLLGISAALHLSPEPYLLLEREGRLGGLARTEERDGFYFDVTGHWLHLRDPEIQALVARIHGDALVEIERQARIFSHGVLTQYPFQANLHGLPANVVYACLLGFVETLTSRGADVPRNFEEYIHHHFGRGIAEHFMVPYNEKLWGVPVSEITSAWCSRFVPLPSVEQVLAGAVGATPCVSPAAGARLGYNVRFRYPRVGGIETFTRGLIDELDPAQTCLGTAPEQIDETARTITIGGETLAYRALISSIPLPALVSLLATPPADVVAACERLRATAVRYLNVGTRCSSTSASGRRGPAPVDYHWVYLPEPRLPAYRVGVFSNAMASMAPAGCSSLYVELSSRTALDEAGRKDVLASLVEIGTIDSVDDVLFADERVVDPAYVVFDEHYEAATSTIHRYLESQRIFSRGRYGAWIYNSMEDSLLAGRDAARRVRALADE